MGINASTSGGIDGRANDIFYKKWIEIIIDVSGYAKRAKENYLQGYSKSTGSVC